MTAAMQRVVSHAAAGEWSELFREARAAADYSQLLQLLRRRRRLLQSGPAPGWTQTVRLALLGGATTELMEEPLRLCLEAAGLGCELYRADYNTLAQEMLDPGGGAARFRPEVAVIVNTPANVPTWPRPGDDRERAAALAAEVCDYWFNLCTTLHGRTGCEIVLNNFHALPARPLGNLGAKAPWDANNFLRRVNRELGDRAPAYVHLNDVEGLAAAHGIDQWFDPRYWHHAKQPVSFECLLPYVRNTARLIGALFGRSAKCLVLDLDNTLWGGVVGDDGPDGIRIGEGDSLGEAFKAFQEYVLRLKERGVLLAACSKNDADNAREPFLARPEMVLKLDDFAAFVANWEPKSDNLRLIARRLNIGTDALVFVDDNPAEREEVRRALPDVTVLELTDDPADYVRLLDATAPFEATAFSAEDAGRTQQYRANELRYEVRESAADYAGYLAALGQKAVVRPFDSASLDRVTQLVNKSNQFNLTTLRLTRSQVEERMDDPAGVTAYVRLTDRFGDNGLISVFAGRLVGADLEIDLWLMSCRVLKRGVEQLLCNYIVERARGRGAAGLVGTYIPTPRNGLVRDHYQDLGFEPDREAAGGATRWRLDLDRFRPFDVAIDVVDGV